MRNTYSIICICLLIFAVLSLSCQDKKPGDSARDIEQAKPKPKISKELLGDMVAFDRAYIPALALTSKEDADGSATAMVILKETWSQFKAKSWDGPEGDDLWTADMESIEDSIIRADEIVTSGGNLIDAHEELEEIRKVTLDLRKRNNTDYFIDYLTEFHDPMEAIVLLAKGKTRNNLSEQDIEFIATTAEGVSTLWDTIMHLDLDTGLYGFSKKKTARLRSLMSAEKDKLEALQTALGFPDNQAGIIMAAIEIKPSFVEILFLFGDFERVEAEQYNGLDVSGDAEE